ncbi:MAG: cell division protein SepF [Oscillospiraceae bacterium]|nr:cell division protein SepF [Oscillospiraceae bacterium]
MNGLKSFIASITKKDNYEVEDNLALDNNYENEYDSEMMSSNTEKKVVRMVEKVRHNLRLYKLEGHNWQQESKKAANDLKNGYSVVVNTESANKDAVTRMADFLSGVTYSIDGKIVRLGNSWTFVPENCDLGGDVYEEVSFEDGLFGS